MFRRCADCLPSASSVVFFLFPVVSVLFHCKSEGEAKKREIKGRKAACMLNLEVIFRAVRLWISVLTVSENELFLFRLAGSASPLPALTLSLFVHSSSFFLPPRLCLALSFHLRCPMLALFHPSFLPNLALTSSTLPRRLSRPLSSPRWWNHLFCPLLET